MQEMPPAVINGVVGLGSAAVTLLITLYVRDSARKIVEESLIKVQIDVKKDIDNALAKFKEDFIRALDITYRRSAECHLMMEQPADRIELLDKRLNASEVTVRDITNFIHKNHKPKEI